MSGMADEMTRRMEADGGFDPAAGAAPGNDGGRQPDPGPSSAGTENTDTGAGQGAPDTIPYARFKEVNDAYSELREFKPLADYGYDPDSLGQLAAFHQAYVSDPVGTWAGMADNLDLPQEVKDAIAAHVASSNDPGSAQGSPSDQPKPQEVALPEDVQRRLDYVDQLRAREEDAQRNQMLDRVMSHWDTLEEQDGTPKEQRTSERVKLNMIAAMGASGHQFNTVEDLAKAGYDTISEHNATVLGGAVRTGRTGTPLSLPGSVPAASGPVKFDSIRAATKAAEAAITRGELAPVRET